MTMTELMQTEGYQAAYQAQDIRMLFMLAYDAMLEHERREDLSRKESLQFGKELLKEMRKLLHDWHWEYCTLDGDDFSDF
jgi:hypothetical protein